MKNLITSVMLGLLLVIPLMIMEWVNRREFAESYAFPVFIVLCLPSAGFTLIVMSIIKDIRSGEGFFRNPLVLIRIILLMLLAIIWGGSWLTRCLVSWVSRIAINPWLTVGLPKSAFRASDCCLRQLSSAQRNLPASIRLFVLMFTDDYQMPTNPDRHSPIISSFRLSLFTSHSLTVTRWTEN